MTCVEALRAAEDRAGSIGARPVGVKFWYAFDRARGWWGKFTTKGLQNWAPVFGPRFALKEWETVRIGETK